MYKCLLLHFIPFCLSICNIFPTASCTPLLRVSPSNASYSIFSSSTPPHASCLLSFPLHGHPPIHLSGHSNVSLATLQSSQCISCFCFQVCQLQRQAGHRGNNVLDQLSGCSGRNGTPRDMHQRMSPGPSAASWPLLSSCPSAFIWPNCSMSSPWS